MEYTFTKENFQAEVLDSEQPVLVDMFAKLVRPKSGSFLAST